MSQASTHEHIIYALHHIDKASRQLEQDEHKVFAAAAFESRITAYGTHCVRRAALERIAAELRTMLATGTLPGAAHGNGAVPIRSSERETDLDSRPTASVPLHAYGDCA